MFIREPIGDVYLSTADLLVLSRAQLIISQAMNAVHPTRSLKMLEALTAPNQPSCSLEMLRYFFRCT